MSTSADHPKALGVCGRSNSERHASSSVLERGLQGRGTGAVGAPPSMILHRVVARALSSTEDVAFHGGEAQRCVRGSFYPWRLNSAFATV